MNKLNILLFLKGLQLTLKDQEYRTFSKDDIVSALVNAANLTDDSHIKIKITEMTVMATDQEIIRAVDDLIFELEH